ncbi:MAG: glycosyltransferase family 2 protein [Dongiaceae bacterium]
MPRVSVVMPVYNVERYVATAIRSVLAQSFADLELIVVDDGGSDGSVAICRAFADPRIRIVAQANRGLAGARNTGIAAARGDYVALLDADDGWLPEKLALHVANLDAHPTVGVSYDGAILIDEQDRPLGIVQAPVDGPVDARLVFTGRVVKNGSVPVMRRAVFDDIARRPPGADRTWYFDESLRRSEDVECWTRIALTTGWGFRGVGRNLTLYRINAGGLSADVTRQLESWEQVCATVASYAPGFIAMHGDEARARELRYLARRAVTSRDRRAALPLLASALRLRPVLLLEEPGKTLATGAAALLQRLLPPDLFAGLSRLALSRS